MKGRIKDNTNVYLDKDLYSYLREFNIMYPDILKLGFAILTTKMNEDEITQSFILYLDANKNKYYIRHPATMAVAFRKFIKNFWDNEYISQQFS